MKNSSFVLLAAVGCLLGAQNASARIVTCDAKELLAHPKSRIAPIRDLKMTIENEKFEMDLVADFGGGKAGSPIALRVNQYSISEVVIDRKGEDVINYRGTAVGLAADLGVTLAQPVLGYGPGYLILQLSGSKTSWRGEIVCKDQFTP
jgi:hypothetical protein